jgi:uncharacterized cupin superfamily protein
VPAGWAITGFACDSVGSTLIESEDNHFIGFLSPVTGEETTAGWADCTVVNSLLAEPRTGSTITARKWGDRTGRTSNQPLQGATMGIWRDNGDGNFQPGGADGASIATCVTLADGTCNFTGLAEGGYWVQEVTPPAGATWNAIHEWGPGSSSSANPAVPYAAYRNGDPDAELSRPGEDFRNGYPIIVSGAGSDRRTTDFFANRRTNPSIGDVTCQALFRIVLVLDRSGSIESNGPDAYENAVTGFVNDLVGTNTQIGIVSFAASASLEEGYTSVLGGPSAALQDAIEDVYNNTGGGTNWDAGLFAVDGPFSPAPDLVVMVTDGNPTLNNTTETSSSEVNWHDFTQAVTSSNLLKSNDSRVITVAAGAAGSISISGLIGISGPLTNQPSALDDDYIIGTPDELAAALREIALARCGASVNVKKEIETSPGVWAPGDGWSFDIDVEGDPNVTPDPPASTALSGGVAEVTFEWVAATTREVTITEQNVAPATDYFDPTIVCWAGPGYEAEGTPLTPISQTTRSVTFDVPTDSDYSCRFRNSPRPTELIIEKTVINDDGGTAVVDDFGITTSAGTLTFTSDGGSPTTVYTADMLLVAAGTYTLSELALAGYTPTDWTCTNGDGGAFDGGSVTLAVGDDPVTCAIANDDDPVELVIEKTVINDDGGTAVVDDFGITTSAGALTFGAPVEGPTDTFTYTAATLMVAAGTYTLSELAVAGYAPTDWTCTNGGGGAFDGGSVTLAVGDPTVTCSITNDDEPVELVVVKTVINDDGGTATVDDFGITTSAGALTFGAAVEGPTDTFTYTAATLEVAPGTYTLAELAVVGYTPTDWTCSNGGGGAFDAGSVTLAPGAPIVTCSITNNDQPVELIIEKTIINDDGGSAVVDDFGIMTSAGPLTFTSDGGSPTTVYTADTLTVAPGTYTLSELAVAGYTPTDWTCSNGGGGAFDDGSVTLAADEPTVTCSITNDDQPVELIIEKVVINDDGGTATVDDFGIATSAGTLTFGAAVEGPTDTFTYTAETVLVTAGAYTLSELAVAGYTPTDWTCTNGGGGPFDAGSVTLAVGDPTVTCSITNDDEPVELVIEKIIINDDGGSAGVDDFGITTSAGTLTFSSDGGSPTTVYTADTLTVAPGTYTLSEIAVAGYAPTDWTCTNGGGGPFDAGSVTVALGDDPVTCSITNNDFSIEVLKVADDHLIPLQGQDVNFTYTVTNTSDVPVEIVVLEDDVFGPLDGDDDCQVGTILPPGGSCEFVETFFVDSDVAPNGDPEQEFPPHVNTVTGCSVPAADTGTAVVFAAVAAPASCDDDPETIEFDPNSAVLPDSGLPPTSVEAIAAMIFPDASGDDLRLLGNLGMLLLAGLVGGLVFFVYRVRRRRQI